MIDSFSIENMKAELARAINKQADIQAMIDKWLAIDNTSLTDIKIAIKQLALIRAIDARNNEP